VVAAAVDGVVALEPGVVVVVAAAGAVVVVGELLLPLS
jgi:hypothetical protein